MGVSELLQKYNNYNWLKYGCAVTNTPFSNIKARIADGSVDIEALLFYINRGKDIANFLHKHQSKGEV